MRKLLLIAALLSFQAMAQNLSMTVGKVQDHYLTSREVLMERIMERVLFAGEKPAAQRPLAVDSKEFFAAVNEALLDWALSLEAKNFDVIHVSESEQKAMESRVSRDLSGASAWKALDPQPAEWKSLLERKLRAKQFVKFRRESSDLPVTDSEAKRYFEENRAKFDGGRSFDELKESIKSFLARSQVDRRLKDWYEVIMTKYNAKNLLSEI